MVSVKQLELNLEVALEEAAEAMLVDFEQKLGLTRSHVT